MLKSLPTDLPEMESLNLTDLNQMAQMAAGLSQDEVLETFSIHRDSLTKDELIYFNEFYNYGRGMAKHQAVQSLLAATKGRNGAQAALQYLKRFAKEFEGDIEGDSSGSFSFQFGQSAPDLKSVK